MFTLVENSHWHCHCETLSLVDGCDVAIYVNNLLSELLHTKPRVVLVLLPTLTTKVFMILYTVWSKHWKNVYLSISAIWEMVERNEITVTWKVTQNSDYSIYIQQNNYIASISEISLPKERMSDLNSSLTETERTQYKSVNGQLNWVAGISRPDISFSVWEPVQSSKM